MLSNFTHILDNSSQVQTLLSSYQNNESLKLHGVAGSLSRIFIAELWRKNPEPITIVVPNRRRAEIYYHDLLELTDSKVFMLPQYDPYFFFNPAKSRGKRMF